MSHSVEASCTFLVPAEVLYKAFLDSRDLSRMTLSPANISPVVGGSFTLYNGGVTGSNVELSPNERIVQKWRFSQWAPEVFSTLELRFIPAGSSRTRLEVRQTGIPDRDGHGNPNQEILVLAGWKDKFFHTIEKVLGFGVDRD